MGKKKKKITLEQRTQALALLRERYPQAFRPVGDVKAFEIGIGIKLTAELKGRLPEGMTSRAIRAALSCYCSQPEYKEVRDIIDNPRINLAGEVVSQVTSEDKKLGKQFSAEQRRIRKLETAVERAAKRREREEAAKAARKAAERKREAAKAAKKKKEEERKTSVTGGKGRRNAPKPALGGSPRGAVKTVSSTSQPIIIVKKRRTIK